MRDVQRLVNQDRNSFAACMVALGYADAMVTGVTRSYDQALDEVLRVIDPAPGGRVMGMSVLLGKGHTLFIADTNVTEMPEAEDLVEIALEAAQAVKALGYTPRVAFMSYSTFGNPSGKWLENIRNAVHILDEMQPGFEYEGEMAPDAALNEKVMKLYPFSRLSGPANVLIMPGLQSANLSAKLLRELGGDATGGPILVGMEKPVQIVPVTANVPDVLTLAVLAAAGIVE